MHHRMKDAKLRSKEISWLSFNARLLQEASDPSVPLLERLRFLGIFSSNLDEFFRVRVATLKRLARLKDAPKIIGHDPQKVLRRLNKTVLEQQEQFEEIYATLLQELEAAGIVIVNETGLDEAQARFVQDYFARQVRPTLVPLMLDDIETLELEDGSIYLACRLWPRREEGKTIHSLIRVPADILPRFVLLPRRGATRCVMLLDDVIRFCLVDLFASLDIGRAEAHMIKLTRDAELDIGDDIAESYLGKVSRGLRKRQEAAPVRVVYDAAMPMKLWRLLQKRLGVTLGEGDEIPGGRYHNFKDFINFPDVGGVELRYRPRPPLRHKDLAGHPSVRKAIEVRDVLLHYPYQSFDCIIDLLREAAIDPHVTAIEITLYRLANRSNVVNALINAARNGKAVTAVLELQARFDESANIAWADRLQRGGVRVIGGVPGLKVHAKLLLITRKRGGKVSRYASIGTGNFNEKTARQYTDHALLTADPRITKEVARVFDFMKSNFLSLRVRHLIVSPFNARSRLSALVKREIKNAKQGLPARIVIKTNHIADPKITRELYQASASGVLVQLMVRGMFSPIIDATGPGAAIQATGLIDRYLEHTRIWYFENAGAQELYLASADLMPRNLDRRVEVICPVYDPALRGELCQYLDYHMRDSVKARLLTGKLKNVYQPPGKGRRIRAQRDIYAWLQSRQEEARSEPRPTPRPGAATSPAAQRTRPSRSTGRAPTTSSTPPKRVTTRARTTAAKQPAIAAPHRRHGDAASKARPSGATS